MIPETLWSVRFPRNPPLSTALPPLTPSADMGSMEKAHGVRECMFLCLPVQLRKRILSPDIVQTKS